MLPIANEQNQIPVHTEISVSMKCFFKQNGLQNKMVFRTEKIGVLDVTNCSKNLKKSTGNIH